MKILNPQSATLTNAEVYAHLISQRHSTSSSSSSTTTTTSAQKRPSTRRLRAPAYEAVTREILEYLSPSSSSSATSSAAKAATTTTGSTAARGKHFPLPIYARNYSDANVRGLVADLAKWELAKAEVLGIVNLAPRDAVSLDALVEEVDERFAAEEQSAILACVEKWLLR